MLPHIDTPVISADNDIIILLSPIITLSSAMVIIFCHFLHVTVWYLCTFGNSARYLSVIIMSVALFFF